MTADDLAPGRRRYLDRIGLVPGQRWLLPWPMTGAEAAGYLLIMLALSVGSIVAVVWATWQLVEPSLWRLVPPLVWLAALRLVLLPGLRRAARPHDLDRRYAALDRDQAAGGRS